MDSLTLPPSIDVKFVPGAGIISFSLLWDFVSFVNLASLFSYAVHILSVSEPVNKTGFTNYHIKMKINPICMPPMMQLYKQKLQIIFYDIFNFLYDMVSFTNRSI